MNLLFRSTRLRLAIWYTTATAILLLLFATGGYFYVRNTLIDRIDDTLKHVIEVVERSIIIQPIATSSKYYKVNKDASFRYNVDIVEDDRIDLEWFSQDRTLLWSTFDRPLNIPIRDRDGGETISVSKELVFRQITDRIEVDGQILGYLRVSHPWFEVTKPIRQLIRDLIIGISLTILSVGAIGWWLSGIAIEPVRQSYNSLKQFTADASHELRNPIATIQTNVQMALNYPEVELHLQQTQLRVIERLTQRLGRLVNDLLFLARSDSGMVESDWQIVQLDALLIEAIEEQKTIAQQKGISLNLEIIEPDNRDRCYEEEPFNILGDWDCLARLFTNLISNAIAYTDSKNIGDRELESSEEGELVKIDVLKSVKVQLQKIQKISLNKKARDSKYFNYLQVTIQDRGKGIPESKLPYIFDRFYRVDAARSRENNISFGTGSGLGLSISKAIVENHKGKITVQSNIGIGTTFTVILPFVEVKN